MYEVSDPLIAEQAHNVPWPANVTQEIFDEIVWVRTADVLHRKASVCLCGMYKCPQLASFF